MRNSILVRSIAAVSGIVMLASVAACGDNTTALSLIHISEPTRH